jgi:hypothetical protein
MHLQLFGKNYVLQLQLHDLSLEKLLGLQQALLLGHVTGEYTCLESQAYTKSFENEISYYLA